MPKIAKVFARQILDSRSFPTIEVSVTLDNGLTAYSSAPGGSINNKVEALELRDQIPSEYFGLGVMKAVQLVNTEVNGKLVGMDPLYQNQIDQALVDLDGTPNKARLGGNSTLATSQAVMKVAALSLNIPLFVYVKEKYRLVQDFRVPTPIFNLINGGRHGSGSLDFQEFQVVPASHLPYRQALRIGVEIFLSLERVLEQKGAIRAVGLEGGFSPNLATNTDALEVLFEACKGTAYTLSKDAFLGIDVSPQNFSKSGRFIIKDKNEPMTSRQLIAFFKELHSQFRVFAFEDALLPDAWGDWKALTAELGATAMIMADDLVATNKTLLLKAIEENSCNAVVIKPNRAGTVTETVEVISLAKQANWHTILSHRSGETNDDFAADLAVGVGTEYVKFGATSRGERVEKYNRLLRIQEQLEEWQAQGTIASSSPGPAPVAAPLPTSLEPSMAQPAAAQTMVIPPQPEPVPAPVQPVSVEPQPLSTAVAEQEILEPPSTTNTLSTPDPVALTPTPDIQIDRPAEVSALTPDAASPLIHTESASPSVVPMPAVSSTIISEPNEDVLVETVGGRAPSLTTTPASVDADIQQSVNQLLGALPSIDQPGTGSVTASPDGGGLRPPTPPTMNG